MNCMLSRMQQALKKANRQMDAQVTEQAERLAVVQKELVKITANLVKEQDETAHVARRLAETEAQAAQLTVALAQQASHALLTTLC